MSFEDIFAEFEEAKEEKSTEEPTKEAAEEKPVEKKPEEETVEEEVPAEKEKVEEFFEEKPTEEEKGTVEATEEFFEEAKEEKKKEKEEAKETVEEVPTPTKEEFDVSEDEGTGKEVYMIYGLKGDGKTWLAFTFPGKIACLSFDRKSKRIRDQMVKINPKNKGRIKVYDAIRYIDSSSAEMYLEASEKSFRYLHVLLDHIAEVFQPDWVVLDGSEIFQRMCEMTMRYRNNLMPFQGIANRNLWKERRMYIRQIHRKALNVARRGVIYTTYTDKDEIIKDGEFVTKKDVPKWIDAIMYETDCVIKVESVRDKTGQRFYATVESSKAEVPTGARKDMTNVGIKAFFQRR